MKKKERIFIRILVALLVLGFVLLLILFYRYARPLVVAPLLAPENITLISPSQQYYNTSLVEFNVTLTDVVLQLNLSLNDAVSELCQNCNGNFTVLNLSDGQYNLTVIAYDGSGNVSKSQSFIVDTLTPGIVFENGTSGNNSLLNNTIFVNLSLIEANVESLTYFFFVINDSVNASGGQSNDTLFLNATPFSTAVLSSNYSVARNGTYLFNVSVVDKTGRENATEARTVFVTYFCIPNWIRNSVCNTSDVNFTYYLDANTCNTNESLPADNGTSAGCDYCTPNWVQYNTSCAADEFTSYYRDVMDCYARTGLPSDLNGMPANRSWSCGATPPPPPPTTPPTTNATSPRNATRIFLNESQIKAGFYATLLSNDIIEFEFYGKHLLKATSILSRSFILIFDSQSSPFFLDDVKEFDLNGDEENDFSIALRNISTGRVSLLLREIPPLYTDNITREATVNETLEIPTEENAIPKRVIFFIAGGIIAFVILLAAVIGIFMWYLKKKRSIAEGKKKPKDQKRKEKS